MILNLDQQGNLNLSTSSDEEAVFNLELVTYSYLADAQLEAAFISKVSNPELSDIVLRLRIVDSVNGDEIIKIQGALDEDPDNLASIVAVADATKEFEVFELALPQEPSDILEAIKSSEAFNSSNSLGRSKTVIELPDDTLPAFDGDEIYTILTNQVEPPAYIVLPQTDDLPIYVAALRAAEKLNIPLDAEIDPTITAEQAAEFALSMDAQSHRVQFIWSPNLCRARDSVSLSGRKIPAPYIGQYIGDKLLRNARTDAEGYAPLHVAVAWKDFPFRKKALELRPDIVLDEPTVEMLAKAKVNVVRPIKFKQGMRYVLSDLLTQRQSKNSALRLVPAAEIAMRTSNEVVSILKEHMLKPTSSYLKDASDDIDDYLSGAVTAGWLKPADDLGGKPYAFRLTPDKNFPFERVRLYLARRPEGATRAVIFDEDVLVK
ncbi:hypothetical protein [Acinetobacter pragensis]|uniref:Uncharacterized protein n=1 Tax=Acinetobacter pragensis TaxID=1806892 RepID=A0A151Y5E0_9GAMM|nr:hypothetical protein [Acinetobacter pragensis]KYQ73248.1 hypothetical protein AZH43_07435 [Acinetobacter pragensis]